MHFFLLFASPFAAENACGDWEPYISGEEKCIKLISSAGTQSFAEAERTCKRTADSRLISVHNADEQAALVDYLFSRHSTVDNVWLGAKYYSGQDFYWEDDGRSLNAFAKWAPHNPKAEKVDTCVQMHSEREIRGQWSNEPCTRLNRVVCERRLQSGQHDKGTLAKLQEQIERMEKRIEKMAANVVPLGFIYVQLPQEKSPQEIWSSTAAMTWTDISSQFDSTFFRVAGSRAGAFGAVQEEFSPYIDQIKFSHYFNGALSGSDSMEAKVPRGGGWTRDLRTAHAYEVPIGGSHVTYNAYHAYHFAGGEVRPRNMAVRVWKRTG